MLKVVGFGPAYGLPSASPFVLKLETWLRMAEIPYASEGSYSPFKAPKGKAPYIVEDDGHTMGDSALIIEHLTRKHGVSLDDGLSDEALARGVALQRLLEDHLYFTVLYARWIDPAGWAVTRAQFFGDLPPVVRSAVPAMVQRGVRKNLHGQGVGRHTRDEIYRLGVEDVRAFATLVGDRQWVLDRPSRFDAVAYAFAAQLLWTPQLPNPMADAARASANLERYASAIRERYWTA